MKKENKGQLHGWDDEKIYFWDEESGQEYCVSDDEKLYRQLVKICREYYHRKFNRGERLA